jgi:dihydrofolate reductase
MRLIRGYMAATLDGYIAAPDGGYDWIVMDPEIDFDAMFKDIDTILIGRKSWEVTGQSGAGGAMPGIQTYVISRTLRQDDVRGATVSSDPAKTVAELRKQPGKDIWLFGGGELFKSMLGLGLVNAIEVGVMPVLLGGGIPMLPSPAQRATLRLVKHQVYAKTGTEGLTYEVK